MPSIGIRFQGKIIGVVDHAGVILNNTLVYEKPNPYDSYRLTVYVHHPDAQKIFSLRPWLRLIDLNDSSRGVR